MLATDASISDSDLTLNGVPQDKTVATTSKGFRFWIIFLAICVSVFVSALEQPAVANALPTIIHDLHGQQFVWISSAYSLAATALLPASGGFAQIFGRRASMLGSLALFALGSALCGSAKDLNWLIAARTIQGAGSGSILALSSIIVSDLVTLQERGTYNGLIGMTWAVASCLAPIIGGALSSEQRWRWLFYLNLPICGVAAALVFVFLRLHTPPGSFTEKLARIDWVGSGIIIAGSSSFIIGLSWGGVQFPWGSPHVLAPLILGILGIGAFLAYEALVAKDPIVPFSILTNRTTLSGYIQTFLCPAITLCIIYFLPVYFQACKGASPIRSGVLSLPVCFTLGPLLVLTGASISITKTYRPQIWAGWALLTVAMAAMISLHAEKPTAAAVGIPVLASAAAGIIYAGTYFPVLAPLRVEQNAYALAFFQFCRSLAAAWGISIGTAILQTQLTSRLPPEFLADLPGGISFAYSVIPVIETLPEPTRTQVRVAFAESIIVIWEVMTGLAALGLVASLAMKAMPLHTEVDRKWGLEEERQAGIGEAEVKRSILPEM